jgi:hypothetical protein
MAEKRDWLGECNDQHVPLDDFQRAFCDRCLQVECARSQHGKSQFEARVATWEERLFNEVPRMDPSDPRYQVLSAKRFITIDTGPVPEVRGWVDPLNLKEPPEVPPTTPEPRTYEVPETTRIRAQAIVDLDEAGPVRAPVEEGPVPESPRVVPQASELNTPAVRGQMVGKKVGGPAVAPVSDPWEPRKSTTDGLKVVPKGAKIRLGGSGV